ncbi:hypothetical protein J3R83DRAFT_1106 [Lanmaoa asiatica]|nr:hypothetical protein J3R83DRAFT_1106 [Lanmaoa asiatica]
MRGLATTSDFPPPPSSLGSYVHVLAYLRSLPGTPERPEVLPRAAQLGSMSPSRLESLLELRDEASYLGLVELYKLCCHEISRFHRSPLPTTSTAAAGVLRGKTGSVHSFRTVIEQCQPHPEVQPSELQPVSKGNGGARTAKFAFRDSGSSSSCENKDVLVRQGRGVKYEMRSPPVGWI